MNGKRRGMRALLLLTAIILLLSAPVFAESLPIQTILVQPAVYSGEKGDVFDYTLEMTLPEGYESEYKSFSIAVRFDNLLKVEDFALETDSIPKDSVEMKTSTLSDHDIFIFTVHDVKKLAGQDKLSVKLKVSLKKDMKDSEGLKNSFVATTIDSEGVEVSKQEDLTAGTAEAEATDQPQVDPVTPDTEAITGTAVPNAKIVIKSGVTTIGEGSADGDGKFKIVINPQSEGDILTVTAHFYQNNAPVSSTNTLTVTESPEEEKEAVDTDFGGDDGMLADIIKFGEGIDLSGSTKENSARLNAALASGKYILIKTGAGTSEIKGAIREIGDAILAIQPAYMSGYPDGTFRPNKEMTRGEVATVFYRLMDGSSGYISDFKDVKSDTWYTDAVGYMEKTGIIKGYKDGTFQPNKNITRAEFAAITAKILNLDTDSYGDPDFKDVKSKHWARGIIAAVKEEGLMQGDGKGKFNPDKEITRAEAATVINRAFNRSGGEFYKKYVESPFKDLETKHWAYGEIVNAAGALFE